MPKFDLHPYQLDAIAFGTLNKATYQMLDMGMGKTAIALSWIKQIPKIGTLVIAPLGTVYSSWPEEISIWSPSLTYTILHDSNKRENLDKKCDLYLVNYEGLPWLLEALKNYYSITSTVPFRHLVLDEGSMLKSHSTKRFKVLKALYPIFSEYKMILSATPAPNGLQDLWSQFFMLDQGERLERNITGFRDKYCTKVGRQGYVFEVKKDSKPIVYELIKDITFRLDAKDHLKMPKCTYTYTEVEPDQVSTKLYKDLETDFMANLGDEEATAFSASALTMKLRQVTQGAIYYDEDEDAPATRAKDCRPYKKLNDSKLRALGTIIESLPGCCILCPIQFRFELQLIQEAYPDSKFIAGGVPASESRKIIKDWNNKKIPLLLCHPLSIGHGLNLQKGGHVVIWFALPWSSEQYTQLNGRVNRQGQTEEVLIHHLISKGTIDEKILKALKRNISGQHSLLNFLREEYKLNKETP